VEDPEVAAVVVCEPSCLSAIKDDWLQLKLRTPMAVRKKLATKSWLVEEFLDRAWERHPKRPTVRGGGAAVLHGHCHQKALWGAESSGGLLNACWAIA
jgi:Fe-S oxidoreductase